MLTFEATSHPGFCSAQFNPVSIAVYQCIGENGDTIENMKFRWAGQSNTFLRVDNIGSTSDIYGNNNTVHFTLLQLNSSTVISSGALANAVCNQVAYDYVHQITYCESGGYILMFDATFSLIGRVVPPNGNLFALDYDFAKGQLLLLASESSSTIMHVYSMDANGNFASLNQFKSFVAGESTVWSTLLDYANQQYYWFVDGSLCVGSYADGSSSVVAANASVNRAATQMGYNYQ